MSSQAPHDDCMPGEVPFIHVLCSPSLCILKYPHGPMAHGHKCTRPELLPRVWAAQDSPPETVPDQGEGGNRAMPSQLSVPAHLTPGYCHLLQVAEEWAQGTFKLNPNDEDIHTANERRLKV